MPDNNTTSNDLPKFNFDWFIYKVYSPAFNRMFYLVKYQEKDTHEHSRFDKWLLKHGIAAVTQTTYILQRLQVLDLHVDIEYEHDNDINSFAALFRTLRDVKKVIIEYEAYTLRYRNRPKPVLVDKVCTRKDLDNLKE